MIATTNPIKINTKTTSIQNLCGFLYSSTIPFNCLFDLNKSSLTLSTYSVNFWILLSVSSSRTPVSFTLVFHSIVLLVMSSIFSSIISSSFFHLSIACSSIYVGSFLLFLTRYVFLLSPFLSSRKALLSV